MARERFTPGDLFLTVTLIGAGLLAVVFALLQHRQNPILSVELLFASSTLFGAGLFAPLKHPFIGGILGFLALIAYFLLTVQRGAPAP